MARELLLYTLQRYFISAATKTKEYAMWREVSSQADHDHSHLNRHNESGWFDESLQFYIPPKGIGEIMSLYSSTLLFSLSTPLGRQRSYGERVN